MQSKINGIWKPLYRFKLQEQLAPDYKVSNWYVSTHPKSHFISTFMAARPAEDRRFALLKMRS
jgi:N-hydroxyarylamine O-acetyltransferase